METTPALVAAAAVVVAVVVMVLLATSVRERHRRREAEVEAAAARAATARLSDEVATLAAQVARMHPAAAEREAAYVITDAGGVPVDHHPPMVRDTFVLNAALGEPLVKAVALGHGVRRALSPQSRARIRVAVRQETRRARKERRREMREVWLAHKRATRSAARDAAGEPPRAASAA